MIKLYKDVKSRVLSGDLDRQESASGSLSPHGKSEGFVSDCLQVLDNTTPGTAIYILSCLCPENMDVIHDLIHLDLSQPHQHTHLPVKRVHTISNSYEEVISYLRAYGDQLPGEVYSRLWFEVTHRWLLTCPFDEEYYKPDEGERDMYCQRLRSELIDRILKID